jgi:tetratricopeptide (TPR) repeat protein
VGDEEPSDFGPNLLCVTWTHPIYGSAGLSTTAPVTAATPDVSPFGIRQLAGNVAEWIAEPYEERAYDRYANGDFSLPVGDNGTPRVIRGTRWEGPAQFARAACRLTASAETISYSAGFRVAIDACAANADPRARAVDLDPVPAAPEFEVTALAEAQAALGANDHETALDAARRSLAAAPELVSAYTIVAKALRGLDRYDEAVEAYREAIAACPHNQSLTHQLAEALHMAGRADEAIDVQRQVLADRPEDPQALLNELVALWSASRFADAVAAADKLIAAGEEGYPVRVVRALAGYELGDLTGALADFEAQLVLDDGDTAARNLRADILAALGRTGEAKAAYEDVLARLDALLADAPDQTELRSRRAYTLLALDRPDEALADAARAAEESPREALAWRSVGRARLALGDVPGAVAAMETARDLAAERIEVRYDLARTLAAAGQPDEARANLVYAAARSPRLAEAATRDEYLGPLLDD